MPVEIRKLVIKGIVQERERKSDNRHAGTYQKPGKRELERQQVNLRKLKSEILGECRELVETILERKTNRY